MRFIFVVALFASACGGCREPDPSCEVDADCDEFERSVCQLGACVCEFDELERCTCDSQERCDEVYGAGERTCVEGACHACVTDEDCGRLGRCDPTGECDQIECLVDDDCEVGFCEGEDCVGCRTDEHCPNGWRCREDGACVACDDTAQCAEGSVCDSDVQVDGIEVVGTNQCGVDCAPQCLDECSDDPDCQLRPRCVVNNPDCIPDGECVTWLSCELPDDCDLRLGDCPDGLQCEALARSFVTPIHYACLDTPCLLDDECGEGRNCYEGRCVQSCESTSDCAVGTCVARVLFDGASCLEPEF